MVQKLLTPRGCALGAWRTISALARAGEAEAHRKDGHLFRVVEDFWRYTQPLAKTVTAGVCEGDAGFMRLPARRLSRYQDAGVRMQLEDWP